MLAHRVISHYRRNASNLHWRDFKDEEFSGIWPTMWIERLLCQIYRLCLSHNYISTSAVFIGLTSLSTYSFGHQRLSKKGGFKVLGFKADCGAVGLNGLGTLLSHGLKESFRPSMCLWQHCSFDHQIMEWKYQVDKLLLLLSSLTRAHYLDMHQ